MCVEVDQAREKNAIPKLVNLLIWKPFYYRFEWPGCAYDPLYDCHGSILYQNGI